MTTTIFVLTIYLNERKREEVLRVIMAFYSRYTKDKGDPPPGVLSPESDMIVATKNGAAVSEVVTFSGNATGFLVLPIMGELAQMLNQADFATELFCPDFETDEQRERRESLDKLARKAS